MLAELTFLLFLMITAVIVILSSHLSKLSQAKVKLAATLSTLFAAACYLILYAAISIKSINLVLVVAALSAIAVYSHGLFVILRSSLSSSVPEDLLRVFAASCADNFWEMDENLRFTSDIGSCRSFTKHGNFTSIGKTRWELAGVDPQSDPSFKHHREILEHRLPFRDFNFSFEIPEHGRQHWKVSGMPVYDYTGKFKGYRGIGTEVSENITSKQEALAAQTRLYNAIENSSEGFVLWDAEDKMVLCNSKFREMFGVVKDYCVPGVKFSAGLRALIDYGFYAGLSEEDRNRIFAERFEHHKNPRKEPFTMATSDGRWLQVFERRTPEGEVVGIWSDVTEIKRRELELAHAYKMDLIGQLTGSIAHDFNNFLAVILGNLELLRSRLTQQDGLSTFVDRSITGAQRAAALTQRLLAFARKQLLQPVATDVGQLVNDMRELLQGSIGGAIQLELSFATALPPAMVDPNQLETALLNLALNAKDAMPNGGKLVLEIRQAEKKDFPDDFSTLNASEFLCLSVRDTGEGIPQEIRDKVFEPFFTTKDVGKGSGLGLAMVDGFVRQSKGRVKIKSSLGKGTEVLLLLPCAEGPANYRLGEDLAVFIPRGNGELILIVEDEAQVRELAGNMLRDLGYEIEVSGDAPAALAKIDLLIDRLSLVLSDVVLPLGMNGIEFARLVRSRRPELPFLFMSGYPQSLSINSETTSAAGHSVNKDSTSSHLDLCGNLLYKPFRRAELAQHVRNAILSNETRQSNEVSRINS